MMAAPGAKKFQVETAVGYLLLTGVLCSVVLLSIGAVWNWLATGSVEMSYPVAKAAAYRFFLDDFRQIRTGPWTPRLITDLGIIVLLLTPFLRVFISVLYFAFVERNAKYAAFTLFVLSVLTYSLWLR